VVDEVGRRGRRGKVKGPGIDKRSASKYQVRVKKDGVVEKINYTSIIFFNPVYFTVLDPINSKVSGNTTITVS
jgi:hypothetical protein